MIVAKSMTPNLVDLGWTCTALPGEASPPDALDEAHRVPHVRHRLTRHLIGRVRALVGGSLRTSTREPRLEQGRGLHSSTLQLYVSTFRGNVGWSLVTVTKTSQVVQKSGRVEAPGLEHNSPSEQMLT
jgi:hypothetical protein